MQLILKTCEVRSWRASDLDALVRYADNLSIWIHLRDRFPHPYTARDGREFIKQTLAQVPKTTFAIAVGREAVGCIGYQLQGDVERVSAEIGYWLGEPHWNKGYATEAAQALIDMAFRTRDIAQLDARCRVMNVASRRVIQKCGFQYQGGGMIGSLALGGMVPVEWFRLDRKTWISLRSWGGGR